MRIVAIGSSSTQGHGASTPDHAYPVQLARELRGRHPGLAVDVINRGIGGQTAQQIRSRLSVDALAPRPDLVILQLGANDAIRGIDLSVFKTAIDEGLRLLAAAGIDVVLMPPQYAPRVLAAPRLTEYLAAIKEGGARHHVTVFRRFDITRTNVLSGRVRLVDLFTSDGLHLNDLGYHCLAVQLADLIGHASLHVR